MKNLIARRAAAAGAQVLVVELPLQVVQQGRKGMLAAFKAALEAHGSRVKLAVLDHVVSFPPVRLPVADITCMCRAAGAKGTLCTPRYNCVLFSFAKSILLQHRHRG